MKRSMLAVLLGACVFAASAQPAHEDAREPTTPAATAQADAKPAAAAAAAKKDRRDPTCLTQTGSRLQPRSQNGCAGYGRSYSRDDLDRTGRTDVGQALRQLDPRLN
ncbi:hypothetical protein [Lysobacter sp. CA199]|uniref:hypothetical protein n=1 Tax=Lysobacter sp. CA199 TaxID=3455608 RepID=UPI003F8D16A8